MHFNPKYRAISCGSRWFTAILLGTAFLSASHPVAASGAEEGPASPAPSWKHGGIGAIGARTGSVVRGKPSIEASAYTLDLLDKAKPSSRGSHRLPRLFRLADIEVQQLQEQETLRETQELADVEEALMEARIMLRRGSSDLAIETLRRALESATLDKSRFAIHSQIGTTLFKTQDYRGASEAFKEAVAIEPNNVSLRCNLSAVLMTIGEVDQAIKELESIDVSIIARRNLLFSVFFNKACAYSLKNNEEEAIKNLYVAAEADPPSTLASLGDPQLDNVRSDPRVDRLRRVIERAVGGE